MSTIASGQRALRMLPRKKRFAALLISWFNKAAPPHMVREEPIPTHASMLRRLKDPEDQSTWEKFHRNYRGLIHGVARRAGLNELEAEEVVQETLIEVARKIPEFHYDPAKDSFKGWLLQITRWRIADQFRKRLSTESAHAGKVPATAMVERIEDPHKSALAEIWDEEWSRQLLQAALAQIKRTVNPAQYEIYHLHVILGKPVSEVKRALGVNAGQIYLAKHRVGSRLQKEMRKLESALL